ncbi:MAG: hypothetical protein PSX36_12920 [bacterium]|nr:hypothetical protein [bacterium]
MKNFDEETYNELHAMAKALLQDGHETDDVKQRLLERSNDIILVTTAVKEAKNEHYKKLSAQGRTYIAIGGLSILLGFLITCINFHANKSVEYAMFGLTSVGIVILFFGLFKIIG